MNKERTTIPRPIYANRNSEFYYRVGDERFHKMTSYLTEKCEELKFDEADFADYATTMFMACLRTANLTEEEMDEFFRRLKKITLDFMKQ